MTVNKVSVHHIEKLTGTPLVSSPKDISRLKESLVTMCFEIGFDLKQIRNKTVILHPNLVRPNPEKIPASSTDPRMIIALAELMLDYGANQVKAGENPGFEFSARQAFLTAGLEEPLRKRGVEICYFDEGPWVTVDNPSGRLYRRITVAKPVLDADLFINIPKWKTHMLTWISLSIKNLLGIIHDNERMLFHRNDISEKIVDLSFVREPDLNVIDGLWAMEGQAPFHGDTVKDYNGIVMGCNMLAVDVVAAQLMGYTIEEVPHLMIAKERRWNGKFQEIQVTGQGIEKLERRFKRPVLSSAGHFDGVQCVECGVCRGCLSAIRHSLDKLSFENKFETVPDLTVISGRSMPNQTTLRTWNGKLILFGNCALEFQFYASGHRQDALVIPGCPPHVLDLANLIESIR